MSGLLKPVTHGHDHRPGGMDPNPDGPYLAGSLIVLSLASSSSRTALDLDPTSVSWGTDQGAETASGYFDLQDDGSGNHAIAILTTGLFVADFSCLVTSNSAPSAGAVAEIQASGANETIGGQDVASWVQRLDGSYLAQPSRRAWLNLTGTPPFFAALSIGQNSGATVNAEVQFLVRYIASSNTGF